MPITDVRIWLSAGSAALLSALALVVFAPWSSGTSSATTIADSASGCAVRLHFTPAGNPTQVSATILSGCQGTGFYLVSDIAQSTTFATSKPQSVYRWTGQAPWVVPLPPCFWQADFVEATSPPVVGQHLHVEHFVAGKLGGKSCGGTVVTVDPTTSTTVAATTTTLQTTTTTVGTTTTLPGSGTTTPTSTPPTTSGVPRGGSAGASTSTTSVTPAPAAALPGTTSTTVAAAIAGDSTASTGTDALAFTGAVAVRTLIIIGVLLTLAGLVMAGLSRSRQSAKD